MKVKLFEKNSKSKRIVAAKSRKLKIMNKKKKERGRNRVFVRKKNIFFSSHLKIKIIINK